MSQNLRRSRRLNSDPDKKDSIPQWFFAAFTGDRSGSMGSMKGASATGLYDWVKTMKETAETNNQTGFISVTTFDNETKRVFDNVDTKTIQFTEEDAIREMTPRGTTRLYDTAVEDLDRLLKNVETFRNSLHPYAKALNPKISVTWVCCTDGKDNESIEYFKGDLKERVLLARKKGVKCFFIAANQDAVLTGSSYGFSGDNSLSFSANKQNAECAFRSVSYNMRRASSGSNNTQFTQNMRVSSLASDDSLGSTLPTIAQPPAATLAISPSFDPLNQTIRRPRRTMIPLRTIPQAPTRLHRQSRFHWIHSRLEQ
jgi:hypothetical protein